MEITPNTVDTGAPAAARPHGRMLHPIVMMLIITGLAMALTYLLNSGEFQRQGKLVVPGTYQVIDKDTSLMQLLETAPRKSGPEAAYPSSFVSAVSAIPTGLTKSAALIFMVMFVGGMFGVLRKTGALDAGIERLLALTRGNVFWLTPLLMLAIACGSTFLGLISEYLVVIPMMLVLADRLKLGPLYATALVTIAAKIGYLASITNPLALNVAQPLVQVAPLSGAWLRILVFVVFMILGIGYVLWHARRAGHVTAENIDHKTRLSWRHMLVLSVLALSVVGLVLGSSRWHWGNVQLSAFYIVVAAVIAIVARLPAREACDAFLDGMKNMILAGLLIGLAEAINLILTESLVLDTVIHQLSTLIEGHSEMLAAQGMVLVQMVLDVLIPSTSGKAAVSIPILGPIGQLSGVSGSTVVQAFLFGNGLMNMITPTSGMLLAFLAAGKINYLTWLRFIWPLFVILFALSLGTMALAVWVGY